MHWKRNTILLFVIIGYIVVCITMNGKSTEEWNSEEERELTIVSQREAEENDYKIMELDIPEVSGIATAEVINHRIAKQEKEERDEFERIVHTYENRLKSGNADFEQQKEPYYLSATWRQFRSGSWNSLFLCWQKDWENTEEKIHLQSFVFHEETGELCDFALLFDRREGVQYVTEDIKKQVMERPGEYKQNALDVISRYNGNYNYLINGNKIVIYFNPNEITPSIDEAKFFTYEASDLKRFLKDSVYTAIKKSRAVNVEQLLTAMCNYK